MAAAHLRSRSESDLCHDGQSQSGRRDAKPQGRQLCSRVRSWRSTPTPARWPGIIKPPRTTLTTGTARKLRYCSMRHGRASRASLWRRPPATDTSSCWTAQTGEHLLTAPLVDPQFLNWASGINAKGQPINNPKKEASDGWRTGRRGFGDELASAELSPRRPDFSTWAQAKSFSMSYLVDTHRPAGRIRIYRRRRWRERRTFRHPGHRLSDRQAEVDARRRRGAGSALHRGRPAVRQRRS